MERRLAFRFYRISRENDAHPTFLSALREIAALQPRAARQHSIAEDNEFRLEQLEDLRPDRVVGELLRLQSTNYPSEVVPDGQEPLDVDNPLGHSVVFCFDTTHSFLAIQEDRRIASAGKLVDYVVAMLRRPSSFLTAPIIHPTAWARFTRGAVRRFSVSIASPTALATAADPNAGTVSQIRAMAAAHRAPLIKIEMSMGHDREGALAGVQRFFENLWQASTNTDASIQSAKALTVIDDVREEIDLVADRLKYHERVELSSRDPHANFRLKRGALLRAVDQNEEFLT